LGEEVLYWDERKIEKRLASVKRSALGERGEKRDRGPRTHVGVESMTDFPLGEKGKGGRKSYEKRHQEGKRERGTNPVRVFIKADYTVAKKERGK